MHCTTRAHRQLSWDVLESETEKTSGGLRYELKPYGFPELVNHNQRIVNDTFDGSLFINEYCRAESPTVHRCT